jgi:hypothetical protein
VPLAGKASIRRPLLVASVIAVAIVVIATGSFFARVGPFARTIAQLRIDPDGALLTAPGATQQQYAVALDLARDLGVRTVASTPSAPRDAAASTLEEERA